VPKSESSAAPAKPRLASLKRPHKQPPLTAAAARALWRRCAPPFLLRNNLSPLCLPVKTYGRCERRLVSLMPAWSAAARRTRVCWTLEECVCACAWIVCVRSRRHRCMAQPLRIRGSDCVRLPCRHAQPLLFGAGVVATVCGAKPWRRALPRPF